MKFKSGDKVLVINGDGWGPRRYRRAKVAKVYKNGNFILEGDENRNQYRQTGSGVKKTQRFYRGDYIEHETAELVAELEGDLADAAAVVNIRSLGGEMARFKDSSRAVQVWALIPDEIKNLFRE